MPKPAKGTVSEIVSALIKPVADKMGLVLWDVRFEKEGPEHYLRIFIENNNLQDAVDIGTCEAFSRAIDPVLDKSDPIEEGYYLEVGSPGLGRKLLKEAHFAASVGKKMRAKLYKPDENGQKEIVGILKEASKDFLIIEQEETQVVINLEKKKAGMFKLCDDEDLFAGKGKKK